MTLQITQDVAADEVLSTSAFALLSGMLLDQRNGSPLIAFGETQ